MDWSLVSTRAPSLDGLIPSSAPLPEPGLMARISNRLAMHLPVAPFDASKGRPLVSFTFDDIPVSAATHGVDLLEEHGAQGTFYIATGLLDTYADHWQVIGPDKVVELHVRGHEIGSHGHIHARADALSVNDMIIDMARNRAALLTIEPSLKIENFAYPYGYASMTGKMRLKEIFRSSRSITPWVNRGRSDKQYLGGMPLVCRELNETAIDRALEETNLSNGWLIFYGHDVALNCSDYGCTPGLLSYALKATKQHGIAITTVAEGLAEKS